MRDYDIPLSEIYEEGGGKRVLIQDGRVSLVDRTTDTPHDLVSVQDTEIPRLIEILVSYMAEQNRHERLDIKYEEYRDDE